VDRAIRVSNHAAGIAGAARGARLPSTVARPRSNGHGCPILLGGSWRCDVARPAAEPGAALLALTLFVSVSRARSNDLADRGAEISFCRIRFGALDGVRSSGGERGAGWCPRPARGSPRCHPRARNRIDPLTCLIDLSRERGTPRPVAAWSTRAPGRSVVSGVLAAPSVPSPDG
jgi:hypothetical protein